MINRMTRIIQNLETGKCAACGRKCKFYICAKCWTHKSVRKAWDEALNRYCMLKKLEQ